MRPSTPAQREQRIRETYALVECLAAEGIQPSVREIVTHIGVASTSTARLYLVELERRGWVKRAGKRSRAVAPTGKVTVVRIGGKLAICEVVL
jgi:SOS-response transcriptional repressor LexA